MYQQLIIATVGCSESDASEVEAYMRNVIFCSTLDWQTAEQLKKAAREAWEDIKYMRTPEGQAYMAQLEAEMMGQ